MIKSFNDFKKKLNEGIFDEPDMYIPIIVPNDKNINIKDIKMLGPSADEDSAVECCVDYIIKEYDWDEDAYQSYDKKVIADDISEFILHFASEVEDDDLEGGKGFSPADETCYVFKISSE